MIVFKLNNLSKNHKNLSNLIQPYNSNHNNNQFLLENDFLIEKLILKLILLIKIYNLIIAIININLT